MANKRTGEQEGNQALALLIARAMKDSGLSGKEIAELCGVTSQAVSNWKSTGRIDKQNLEKLAGLAGKPLEYFSTLPPEARHYRHTVPGRQPRDPQARESAARYNAGKSTPGVAGEAKGLAARIMRLPPEQRRLIEQLVDQLAAGHAA
ncbi:MAG TPA: helix-turn-helix transcriptional regulator [Burkholderiaceae bacterium]